MTKTTHLVIILVVLVAAFAVTPSAAGQSRWRNRSRAASIRRPAATRSGHQTDNATRFRSSYPAAYYYPKYTGGFHARYYDGVPSIYGTHPMRGTAW